MSWGAGVGSSSSLCTKMESGRPAEESGAAGVRALFLSAEEVVRKPDPMPMREMGGSGRPVGSRPAASAWRGRAERWRISSSPAAPTNPRPVRNSTWPCSWRHAGFHRHGQGPDPEEPFETLNAYPEPMAEIVFRRRGMIDEFRGDGFIAVLGVRCATGSEPELALTAASELAEAGEASSRERAGSPWLGLGCGAHWVTAAAGAWGAF